MNVQLACLIRILSHTWIYTLPLIFFILLQINQIQRVNNCTCVFVVSDAEASTCK